MKQNFELLFLKNNFSKPVQSVKISRMRSESFARTDTDRKHSVYQNFERRTRSRPPKGPKLPGGNRPAKYAPHVSPSIATHRRVRFEKPFETMIRKFISIYGNKYTVLL